MQPDRFSLLFSSVSFRTFFSFSQFFFATCPPASLPRPPACLCTPRPPRTSAPCKQTGRREVLRACACDQSRSLAPAAAPPIVGTAPPGWPLPTPAARPERRPGRRRGWRREPGKRDGSGRSWRSKRLESRRPREGLQQLGRWGRPPAPSSSIQPGSPCRSLRSRSIQVTRRHGRLRAQPTPSTRSAASA